MVWGTANESSLTFAGTQNSNMSDEGAKEQPQGGFFGFCQPTPSNPFKPFSNHLSNPIKQNSNPLKPLQTHIKPIFKKTVWIVAGNNFLLLNGVKKVQQNKQTKTLLLQIASKTLLLQQNCA